jgi:hypothetical protein
MKGEARRCITDAPLRHASDDSKNIPHRSAWHNGSFVMAGSRSLGPHAGVARKLNA